MNDSMIINNTRVVFMTLVFVATNTKVITKEMSTFVFTVVSFLFLSRLSGNSACFSLFKVRLKQ